MIIEVLSNKKMCKVQCEHCLTTRECQVVNAKRSLKLNGKTICKKCLYLQSDYKEKMSFSLSGEKNPFYGKKHTDKTKKIISLKKIGAPSPQKGRVYSEEVKLNISLSLRGKRAKEKNPNWRGGVSNTRKSIYNCFDAKIWRNFCKKRDGYKCVLCGSCKKIQVDHIKPFSIILEENSIKTLEQAWDCAELWYVDNGRTLCKVCHIKTDTYGHNTKLKLEKIRNSKTNGI